MNQKLEPNDEELYRRVDEILHYKWDPIGISSMPAARDEYYSYLPSVFSLLKSKASAEILAKHLDDIVTERMGLQGNMKTSMEVASILQDWKETSDKKSA